MHHVINVVPVTHKVDPQQASVAVGGVEGLEAVTQVVFHCQPSQTAAQVLHERREQTTSSTVLKSLLHNQSGTFFF